MKSEKSLGKLIWDSELFLNTVASARLLNTKVIRAPGPAHLSPGEHLDFTAVELAAFKLAAAADTSPPTCRRQLAVRL